MGGKTAATAANAVRVTIDHAGDTERTVTVKWTNCEVRLRIARNLPFRRYSDR